MKKMTPAQEAKRKKVAQKRVDYTKKREAAKRLAKAESYVVKKAQKLAQK